MEAICAKIALQCHVSRKTAKQDFVPFIKIILEKQKSSPISSWLKLDAEDVEYIIKMNKL